MKKILQLVIDLKGSCSGVTTTQVERTEYKALYKRSEGYWECFYIIETGYNIFKDGVWTKTEDTVERYPRDEKFGLTAWCGREKSIRARYKAMHERKNDNSNSDVLIFFPRSIESSLMIPLA